MKIIYNQLQSKSIFDKFGIENCCFKQLFYSDDMRITTKKVHRHNTFEVHIIEKGHQVYKAGEHEYKISAGEFLVIPPGIKHNLVESSPRTSKFSMTFNMDDDSSFYDVQYDIITQNMAQNIYFIKTESKNKSILSHQLVENRIFEMLMLVLRQCGLKENSVVSPEKNEDARISLAKQYIKDNIEFNLNVADVASYCYISPKQLTRLFKIADEITPAMYIKAKKTKHIEKLLTKTTLTLNEISQKMNFANEHHFSAFFKKYAGMAPGEYRRMNK